MYTQAKRNLAFLMPSLNEKDIAELLIARDIFSLAPQVCMPRLATRVL